jgi:hypothetical protein
MENGVPQTAGWFVVNARDAPWMHNDMRTVCKFGGEGRERRLETWDLVHCPDRTPHTILATGDEPALILAVGARKEPAGVRSPVDDTARRHGAGVDRETASPPEAYARFQTPQPGPAPNVF